MYPFRPSLRSPSSLLVPGFFAAQRRRVGIIRGGASQRRTFERRLTSSSSPPTTASSATPDRFEMMTSSRRSFHRSSPQQRLRNDYNNNVVVDKFVSILKNLFSWKSIAFLTTFGGAYVWVVESAKREKADKAAGEKKRAVERAALGGDWTLTRASDGTAGGSAEDLRGNFALIYFGFTHCPDICPEEMEKVAKVADAVDADDRLSKRTKLIPVFVTIDPERDTAAVVKSYVAEFTPKMIGYVGSAEEVRAVSRRFRVYYSKGPEDEDGDYTVDHTIVAYLVDPDGAFDDYYVQNKKAEEMIESVTGKMMRWEAAERRAEGGILARMLS